MISVEAGKNKEYTIMKKKIVVVMRALLPHHREMIREAAEKYGYTVMFFNENAEAYDEAEDAEILVGVGADLLKAGKELKWFHSQSAGVDSYLAPGVITDEKLLLTNNSGAYGVTLAEHTIMLTLELLRRQMVFNRIVAERKWDKSPTFRSILGSRVTIMGTGDIGCEIAKRLKGFAPASVAGVNRRGKNPDRTLFDRIFIQEELDSILPETDILLMALPGTDKTQHMIDARRIALLPQHAVIVNVGRGNAIDQYALADALNAGRLYGAALDVFEKEPLDPADPLWETENLLITPHVAGNMTLGYTVDKTVELFLKELENYADGRPLKRLVDRSAGY